MKYTNNKIELLGDLFTPLGVFLKIREKYSQVLLMESSDYSSKENGRSYLCFDSLSHLYLKNNKLHVDDRQLASFDLVKEIEAYLDGFRIENADPSDGVFGFSSFDSVQFFENIKHVEALDNNEIPVVRYDFFRFVISFDHFHNTLEIKEHCPEGEKSKIKDVQDLLLRSDFQSYSFKLEGEETANISEEAYMKAVTKAKEHCKRGDVFQLVLSRRFSQKFKGDELNVYRLLRSINPSPYLFYFDYVSYRIFGSSPEVQLKVEDKKAEIHPIAGTFRRTGDSLWDAKQATALTKDPKESAEHIMLVDLARNDLSKNCTNVMVESLKEIQYFSHVIHLVSKVTGKLKPNTSGYQVFADTFPAGTLSGAPKYKALQLIDKYESSNRGFYGGGLGHLAFNGDINHAIIIRSFVSQKNTLHYQAGAGLVISSKEESELQEVNNKLAALKQALINAQNL